MSLISLLRSSTAPKAFLAVALVAIGGCGSTSSKSTDGGSDSPIAPTIEQACSDIAQAECTKRMTCSGGDSVTRVFGTMENCIAREMLSCTNGLSAPQTGNSPVLVEACVAAFATYSCADFFNNNPPGSCVATGLRATGAACAFSAQCASAYCQGLKNSSCGTCEAPPAPGAPCDSSSCWHDQTCVGATTMCAADGVLNASCDANDPCGYGLTCVGAVASTSTPGTCQAAVEATGTACGGTMSGCDGTSGLFCGGASGSKTCMAITYVGDGMPCGDLSSTSHAECIAGGCYTSTGSAGSGQTGTCKSDTADGTACDTVLGPGCVTPARCVISGDGSAGTCEIPLGSTCG
jgi:hypothetical protein